MDINKACKAIDRGGEDYWRMLGDMQGNRCRERDGLHWVEGRIGCIFKTDGNAERAEAITRGMANGNLPDRLVLSSETAMLAKGFRDRAEFSVETDWGMAKELIAANNDTEPPANLRVFPVTKPEQLKAAGSVLNASFGYDLFTFADYAAFHQVRRFYLAEWDGLAAGAVMARLGDWLEITWVGTLPGYRKKGIAGALLRLAEREAAAQGIKLSVLTSFPGAVGAYVRAGYQKCCEIPVIMWRIEINE